VSVWIEVWSPRGREPLLLEGPRLTLGRGQGSTVRLSWDGSVSRLHAVVEHLDGGWCIRDVNSRNGTYVNGDRIAPERVLRDGDEIRVGETRLEFRVAGGADPEVETTRGVEKAPELTHRQRDVLKALCCPRTGDVFTEPASIAAMAETLHLSEAAIKQHLSRLYDRFGLNDAADRRRSRLANEALRRGAISAADIRPLP